jgi:hypothetical protein
MVTAMGLDPLDYFVDPDNPEVMQQIEAKEQERQQQEQASNQAVQAQNAANTSLIKAEIDNKKIDNKRQLLEAEDESNRNWAEIKIKAEGTEGAVLPVKIPVDFQGLYQDTEEIEKQAAEQQQQQQQQMQQMQQMQGGMQNG